ncbi:MAG: efflux RND transporter permease subunit [Verrucomicrobiae bacterium]|nr:efflux RND transporter permease subunit [Verrucomicrobiae bacterium]
MILRLIDWSLRNRLLVLVFSLLVAGWGIWAAFHTPVDAIPDLSENQVIVFADWTGRSPREIEDQVTYPLTVNLRGLAGVKTVRASSNFGFSMVTVIFEDRVDPWFARTRVLERLNTIGSLMPRGVVPVLGPDATGLGWVYQYYLDASVAAARGRGYDLGELRALQDWLVRYQLNAVPGVAEVASVGGFVRQYQVDVSPNKLRAFGVTLSQVAEAVIGSNNNVGGNVIEQNGMEYAVRGLGLFRGVDEIAQTLVATRAGQPVLVRDVARVEIGPEPRRGALDRNGSEVVGGIVIARYGVSTSDLLVRVKAKVAEVQKALPEGVEIRPFYDRSALIARAVGTLQAALLEAVLLVTLAHVVFLFHFRSIAIVTIPLPLSILISFILMKEFGITSNIMSLSGIVIAIGVLVDAGIVVTESVMREAHAWIRRDAPDASDAEKRRYLATNIVGITRAATRLVARPIFYSMAIIILAFIPVFALGGQAGKLFHPLAFTKTFAMVASTALAVTLVPVLCTLLVRGKIHDENENWLMRRLLHLYLPLLRFCLNHRALTVALAAALLAGASLLALRLGREFMPPLNERALLFMPQTLPSASITEVRKVAAEQDRVLSRFPEVEEVVAKVGRAETATDPAPVAMIETTITLKPERLWRRGMTLEKLKGEMIEAMSRFPGFTPALLQPIENRVLMLATGIRAQVAVKLFAAGLKDAEGRPLDVQESLAVLEAKAIEVEAALRSVPGATGVYAERIVGAPYLEVDMQRAELARYGVPMRDALDAIETAVGGRTLTTTLEGRFRFPVRVRYARELRDTRSAIENILVSTADGVPVPLGKVATLRTVMGPSMISSEDGQLRVFVQCNVRGRDLGGFVEEAKAKIAAEISMPPGSFLGWGGEYENLIHARRTLQVIIPVVLLIIFVLLYVVYRSLKEAAHVLLAVPFALTGGVLLQWLLGYPFSVAVWVGYIALFGTAVQTGVIMVIYLEEAVARRAAEHGGHLSPARLLEAVVEGAALRLRPKVMTVSTVLASLVPLMLPIFSAERTGIEIMRPIAAPVIGGMISSLAHILLVTPVIFFWIRAREFQKSQPATQENPS